MNLNDEIIETVVLKLLEEKKKEGTNYLENTQLLNEKIDSLQNSLSLVEDILITDPYEFASLLMFFYRNTDVSINNFIGRKLKPILFSNVKNYKNIDGSNKQRSEEYKLATEKVIDETKDILPIIHSKEFVYQQECIRLFTLLDTVEEKLDKKDNKRGTELLKIINSRFDVFRNSVGLICLEFFELQEDLELMKIDETFTVYAHNWPKEGTTITLKEFSYTVIETLYNLNNAKNSISTIVRKIF